MKSPGRNGPTAGIGTLTSGRDTPIGGRRPVPAPTRLRPFENSPKATQPGFERTQAPAERRQPTPEQPLAMRTSRPYAAHIRLLRSKDPLAPRTRPGNATALQGSPRPFPRPVGPDHSATITRCRPSPQWKPSSTPATAAANGMLYQTRIESHAPQVISQAFAGPISVRSPPA